MFSRPARVCLFCCVFSFSALAQVPTRSIAVPGTLASGPCSATSSVTICMPSNNSNINGPVEVSAASNVSGLTLMRVYDNNDVLYETPASNLDTFLYVGSGNHEITVVAYDGNGNAYQQNTSFTVTNGSAGQPCGNPATDATINICYPTGGLTVGSPVTISGTARWDCCAISHERLYVDNKDVWDASYGAPISTQLSLSPGSHNLVAIAWDNFGNFIKKSAAFAVASNSCRTTSKVAFCWPTNNATAPTPVQVTAASSLSNLTRIRLYDNNQNVYQTTNSSFNTDLSIGQGLHHLVVVAYDSSGNAYTDQRYLTVTGTGSQFPCGIPQVGTEINICAPQEFSQVNSPVTVSAYPQWEGQVISHVRIYMDHVDVYDANYAQIINHQFTLASGQHYMVIIAWDNSGNYIEDARTFFVP